MFNAVGFLGSLYNEFDYTGVYITHIYTHRQNGSFIKSTS